MVDLRMQIMHWLVMEHENFAKQMQALGNPVRLMVYRQLVRAGNSGAPVGTIQKALDLAGSTLTNHLQKLVGVGLAHQERQSTELICTADFKAMRAMINYLEEQCCIDEC